MTVAIECLVNQQRVRFGLPALEDSVRLDHAAQGWTDYLVSTGQAFHGDVSGRMTAAGYPWEEGGENIAGGYLTPRDMISGWMGSLEHCQNILWPDFRDMGAGENAGGSGPAFWTMDFGLQIGQNPASSNYGPMDGCPYTVSPSAWPGSTGNGGGPQGGSGSGNGGSGSGWPTNPCDTPTQDCPTSASSPADPTPSSSTPAGG